MNIDAYKIMNWLNSLKDMLCEDKISKEVFDASVESVMNIARIIGVEKEVMELQKGK